MKLIVGLGNPGKEYENTRHNAGFLAIDKVCKKLDIQLDKSKCKAIYGIYRKDDEKYIFAKPQTFMNLSGEAVTSLMNFYDIDVKDLIVIHDDLDLPVGKIRLRYQGSSGGQKGMGNIIDLLSTQLINRIRIGISNNKLIDTKDYVLGKFDSNEIEELNKVLNNAGEMIDYYLNNSFDKFMSKYN